MFLSIMKFLLKGSVKKSLKAIVDDPEVKEAKEGIEFHSKELNKQIKAYEKKYGKKAPGRKLQGYPWKGGYI